MTAERRIIGHGTWYDKTAYELIERERRLGRDLSLIRVESGVGASGFPHIGSFADAARAYAVKLALEEMGCKSELIAFSDDKDGLRKVPAGLPKWLEKYLGYPVTDIPDPFGCHDSYGEHMSSLLLDALDKCGIEYKFYSGTEVYRSGLLNREIREILEKAEHVGRIVWEEVGQEKFLKALPYFPVCSNCGRIYTTKAYKFLPKEGKILYVCEGMEVRGKWLKGCGNRDEVDYRAGEGKLSWKAEFAARWRALDVRFEAYGKDIADSVRVNDRVSREVLGYEPPMHAQYEMFLDKGGRKISKSAGNVLTPQVWFRYGSPQSLMLLVLKRFVGTRTVSVDDIPTYMDELDRLEEVYFGLRDIPNPLERGRLRGLYLYVWTMKPPEKPDIHVPYGTLLNLARVAPHGSEVEYMVAKLREYGILKGEPTEGLMRRIGYALNWVREVEAPETRPVELTDEEAEAVRDVLEAVRRLEDGEEIQAAVFEAARRHGVPAGRLFRKLYQILIGRSSGPRLGPYIVAMGRDRAAKLLEEALAGKR